MKELTQSAQKRLDKYLSQVRTSLQKYTSVDADEVQRDIREHIETELQGLSEPVSLQHLEAVLDRLGSPGQWVPDEEISWWRKVILRLRTGPEDWRLAYISFGLFLLSFLVAGEVGLFAILVSPILILEGSAQGILLLAGFCVSRALLAVTPDRDKLGGQKWLIYPSLVFIYAPLALLMFGWPGLLYKVHDSVTESLADLAAGLSVAAMGLWWITLGVVFCIWPNLLRAIFRPFADKFNRKEAVMLMVIGLVLIILGVGGSAMTYFQ
jgi:hypothetical protein